MPLKTPCKRGLLIGKILSAAPTAISIRLTPHDKPYLSGILNDIDKSIRATARTITRISLKDKIKNETVLAKAGLRCLTDIVCESMACTIWKARKDMNPLGRIFQNKISTKVTRSTSCDNLCQPVPGHPEAAANKLAQIWNLSNLSAAKTLGNAKSSVKEWFKVKQTALSDPSPT